MRIHWLAVVGSLAVLLVACDEPTPPPGGRVVPVGEAPATPPDPHKHAQQTATNISDPVCFNDQDCGTATCETCTCQNPGENNAKCNCSNLPHQYTCNGTTCCTAFDTQACTTSCSLISCSAPMHNCDTSALSCETNVDTSVTHCGGCGQSCSSAHITRSCSGGSCEGGTCTAPFMDCFNGKRADGCETDTSSDTANCGGCGTNCGNLAHVGTTSCSGGACGFSSCATGYAACDSTVSNGCEQVVNTLASCGTCGSLASCSTTIKNATGTNCAAQSGGTALKPIFACRYSACSAGFGDCDGSLDNGCETTINSLTACGVCGALGNCSTSVKNASAVSCIVKTGNTYQCSYGACATGFMDCNSNKADGCEVDITKIAACGACNNNCASKVGHVALAQITCTVDKCGYTGDCDENWGDCDGDASNGCETSLLTDAANCKTCKNACTAPTDGTAVCNSGVCDFTCGGSKLKCETTCADCCASSDCTSSPIPSNKCLIGTCTDGTCSYPSKPCIAECRGSDLHCDTDTGLCVGTILQGAACGSGGCCAEGGTCAADGTCNCVNNEAKDCSAGVKLCEKATCANGTCGKDTLPNDQSCASLNKCLVAPTCINGDCVGDDKVCPSSICTQPSCDQATGACSESPKAVGFPCTSGDTCQQNEACDDTGHCLGTTLADTTPCSLSGCASATCQSGLCTCASSGGDDLGVDQVVDMFGQSAPDLSPPGRPKGGCNAASSGAPVDGGFAMLLMLAALVVERRRAINKR